MLTKCHWHVYCVLEALSNQGLRVALPRFFKLLLLKWLQCVITHSSMPLVGHIIILLTYLLLIYFVYLSDFTSQLCLIDLLNTNTFVLDPCSPVCPFVQHYPFTFTPFEMFLIYLLVADMRKVGHDCCLVASSIVRGLTRWTLLVSRVGKKQWLRRCWLFLQLIICKQLLKWSAPKLEHFSNWGVDRSARTVQQRCKETWLSTRPVLDH